MRIERVGISLARLPRAFDGMTVAVIADLHAGFSRRGPASVRQLVQQTNRLGADLIVLLGDLVHRSRHAEIFLPLLADLEAPAGKWACLGNHEHGFVWYSRWAKPRPSFSVEEWRALYAEAGIRLLVNEARPVACRGERLWLVGADDPYSGRDDLAAALAGVRPGEVRLALSHSPDLVDDPRISEVDLLLAGHTHGGQVWLPGVGPFLAPCRRPRQRAAGLVRHNGTLMYVSRGVGEGLPLRIGCPREIALLTLRAG